MMAVRGIYFKVFKNFTVILLICVFFNISSPLGYSLSFKESCTKIFSNKIVAKAIPQVFLLGTVGGGFYITSQITQTIPDEYSYLSNIVTFASGMAVVAIGAPIFRKFMPIIDKQAFKISLMPQAQPPTEVPSQSLGQIWEAMNAHFDVNSQMAINQLTKVQDLVSSTVTRILAFSGSPEERQKYVLYQFIWLATIYHKFFYYISPNDQTTAYSVSMMAGSLPDIDYIKLKKDSELLLTKLYPEESSYYEALLSTWFDKILNPTQLTADSDSSPNNDFKMPTF